MSEGEWVRTVDDDGDVFYVNTVTEESRWTKPGWHLITDDDGDTFWHNDVTEEMSWDRPEGMTSDEEAEEVALHAEAHGGAAAETDTDAGTGDADDDGTEAGEAEAIAKAEAEAEAKAAAVRAEAEAKAKTEATRADVDAKEKAEAEAKAEATCAGAEAAREASAAKTKPAVADEAAGAIAAPPLPPGADRPPSPPPPPPEQPGTATGRVHATSVHVSAPSGEAHTVDRVAAQTAHAVAFIGSDDETVPAPTASGESKIEGAAAGVKPTVSGLVPCGPVPGKLRESFLNHDALAEIPFFETCSRRDTGAVAIAFETFTCRRGGTVFSQGDLATSMFIVAKGEVKVTAPSGDSAILGVREVFGDTTLLKPSVRRQFTASAHTDVCLLGLSHEKLVRELGLRWFQAGLQDLLERDFSYVSPFLDDVPFFRSAPDETMQSLGETVALMPASTGQVLVREGHAGEAFFVLLSGTVRVTARGKRLADLPTGSYFGEIALLKNVNCTASVASLGDSLLMVLYKPQFDDLLGRVPGLQDALDSYVSQRTGNRILTLKVPIFKGVVERQLVRLSQVVRFRRFNAGDVLFAEGTVDTHMCYLVTQGVLSVTKAGSTQVKNIGSGGCVGEMSLVSDSARLCTATAATSASVIEFGRSDVMYMFQDDLAALGKFEVRLLRDDCSMEQLLRFPNAMDAFSDFCSGVVDSDILECLLSTDNFRRIRSQTDDMSPEALRLALRITNTLKSALGSDESDDDGPAATLASVVTPASLATVVEAVRLASAGDGGAVAASLFDGLRAELLAAVKGRLNTLFANFKKSPAFRRVLRQAGSLDEQDSAVTRKYGRFEADKQTRYGNWQARILSFDLDQAKLIVSDRNEDKLHEFKLLGMQKIERSNKRPRHITITFRDSTRPYELRFADTEQREQFCMLAYILEPDLTFTNDCESRQSDTCVHYEVSLVASRVKRHRILSIDSDTRILQRINPKGTSKSFLLDETVILEASRTDPKRLTILTPSCDEVTAEYVFPTAASRQTFAGRVRAICAGVNLSHVRVLGVVNAGFKGRDLSVWTGTWNVGDTAPPTDPSVLASWLQPGKYDMYAIGFQECDKKDEWITCLTQLLDPTSELVTKPKKNMFKRVLKASKVFKKKKKKKAEGAAKVRRQSIAAPKEGAEAAGIDLATATITEVLTNTHLVKAFGQYLLQEGKSVRLDFWQAVTTFQARASGAVEPPSDFDIRVDADFIVDTFLKPDAAEPLDVATETRARLLAAASSGASMESLFDECLEEVAAMLAHDLQLWKQDQADNPPESEYVVAVGEYSLVTTVSLWGIHLVVFAKRDVAAEITHVQTSTVATGLGQVMGNKGGAACSFVYRDATSFAFVSTHLAARASRLKQRGQNYESICHSLSLGAKSMQFLHEFHHVFWLGDLNYRTDFERGLGGTEDEFNLVQDMIQRGEIWRLRQFDQLNKERRRKPLFAGFKEGVLRFPPTYRMLKGSAGYSNKKNQNASWCDRVLWRSFPLYKHRCILTNYDACMSLVQSDHRPVYATFTVKTMLPYLNTSSTTASNYGQCHISIPFMKFEADQPAAEHRSSIISTFASVTDMDDDDDDDDAPAGAGSGAGAGAGAGATPGSVDVDEEDDNILKPGDVNITITAQFLDKPRDTLYSHFNGRDAEWMEHQIPLAIPFIPEAGWLMNQHIILVVRTKSGAVMGHAELPLFRARTHKPVPTRELSLHRVLDDADLRGQFETQLRREYCHENFDFFYAVERFRVKGTGLPGDEAKHIPPTAPVPFDALVRSAELVMATFVNASAPLLVNLPLDCIDTLRAKIVDGSVTPHMFDEAQAEIFHIMATDSFPRFREAYAKEQANIRSRGGGAPFTIDVVRDGSRVGKLSGQATLQSFDDLREKSERMAAMRKLINRRREQADIDKRLQSFSGEGEADAMNSEDEEDLMASLLALGMKQHAQGGTLMSEADFDAFNEDASAEYRDELEQAVHQYLGRKDGGTAGKRFRILLRLTYDRMRRAERQAAQLRAATVGETGHHPDEDEVISAIMARTGDVSGDAAEASTHPVPSVELADAPGAGGTSPPTTSPSE